MEEKKRKKNWKGKIYIPRLELCSGPLKLMVAVSKTDEPREEGVELNVWGTDDDHCWDHVTKHHSREVGQIFKSEVLDAVESQREREREQYTQRPQVWIERRYMKMQQ